MKRDPTRWIQHATTRNTAIAASDLPTDNSWLRATSGPRTAERRLKPGPGDVGLVPARLEPTSLTPLVCGYCSTGCSLDVHVKDGLPVNITPTLRYPVNRGQACPKGWEALTVLAASDRATSPLLRDKRGRLRTVNWDRALRVFCQRFKQLQSRHGTESVAFLSTGQITTEEMAYLGCLTKFGMQLVHGDGNTRQCMATAVVAYKQSFGFDAPPYTYQDLEQSDVIILIGSNLCIAHPILWQRICRNPHQPRIVVIDPRKTETAMAATDHLALRPKSDLVLMYGVANILIENDWIDRPFIDRHTTGFPEFQRHVAAFTAGRVADQTGLTETQIHRLAKTIGEGKRVSFWWTMGVNQSFQGVRTAQSIINLALMTGNIGRKGTGPNSITGQCNAMGSRLFSNTTCLLGGRDFTCSKDRTEVANILGIDPERIPDCNSWSYRQIMEGILRGKIKGLWVIATNTAHSWINQNACHDILDRLDFLVVQDIYANTETARRADLLLPAAGWGEKEGTFINSERRIGVVRKVHKAPGEALSDFAIFQLIARYWGCDHLFRSWNQPEDVFQSLKKLSRGQPCDFSGIRDYAMIERHGGIQWPLREEDGQLYHDITPVVVAGSNGAVPENRSLHERRLFEDGRFFTPDGRARFLFADLAVMPELPNSRFPYLLLTGRGSAAQWHTQTRTSKSAVLRTLYPQAPYVEINSDDARREGIRPDDWVVVQSQRGRLRAKAFVTPTVAPGQVFIPMHDNQTNKLTHAHFDPYSQQPSYKDCAVRIRRNDHDQQS